MNQWRKLKQNEAKRLRATTFTIAKLKSNEYIGSNREKAGTAPI